MIVALTDPRAKVLIRGRTLTVQSGSGEQRPLQLLSVSELHFFGPVGLTGPARNRLLRESVELVFFTGDGRFIGRMSPNASPFAGRRLKQYAMIQSAERRLTLARAFIDGKIQNQRQVLMRRQRRLKEPALGNVLLFLRATRAQARAAETLDQLRGYEGIAAKRYFEGMGLALVNPNFRLNGRNRRPPKDPVNAVLSFGYALLFAKVDQAVRHAGLDASLGCLHESSRDKPALSLDIMEEFRPIVDAIALRLFNRGELCPEDFRTPTQEELGAEAELGEGAVYLGKVAKQVVIRAFERKILSPAYHSQRQQNWRIKDLFIEQCRQVARYVDDPSVFYQPITLGR